MDLPNVMQQRQSVFIQIVFVKENYRTEKHFGLRKVVSRNKHQIMVDQFMPEPLSEVEE